MVGKTYYSRWGKNRVRRFDRFRILSIYDRRRSRAGVSCAASITRCTSGVGACVRGHVHEKRPTRGVSIYIYIHRHIQMCMCIHLNNAARIEAGLDETYGSIPVIYGYPYLSLIAALPVGALDVAENSIFVNNTHL